MAEQCKGELASVTSFNRRLPEEEVELPRSGYEEHSVPRKNVCAMLGESFLNEDLARVVAFLILGDHDEPLNTNDQTKIGGELQHEEE